jgi:hypothetical protein
MEQERKDSTRTKMIKEAKIEDDFLGIKKGVKAVTTKASELADRFGYTQEEEYKKPIQKKAAGGFVRAADGIAKRGKTKGRMV